MAHEIEGNNAFFGNNVPAWHGLGTVIEADVVTTEDAIVLAGLDWEVLKLRYKPTVEIDGEDVVLDSPERAYQMVRSSDRKILGHVGERYKVFNNIDAFGFGDALVDTRDAKWHTAGSLFGGSKTWMLMKLPADTCIMGEETEKHELYICFQNSHDGSSAITAFVTPVRVVCQNTLSFALSGTQRKFSIRHTGNAMDYVAKAQEALSVGFNIMGQLEREATQLIQAEVSPQRFTALMDHLLPLPQESDYEKVSGFKRAHTRIDGRRDTIRTYFNESPNLQNVQGTAWAALNAISEVNDHASEQRKNVHDINETRFEKLIEGSPIVQSTYDYLMDQVVAA
jgi:phage/plasmid-like protein (TIGR03299 family)